MPRAIAAKEGRKCAEVGGGRGVGVGVEQGLPVMAIR